MDPYYWSWWGWGHTWMWIFPLIFFGLCAYFMFAMSGGMGHHWARSGGESAGEILDRRYAKGEISREQYQEMKRTLKA